jgi:RNA recognition motif-containing protein
MTSLDDARRAVAELHAKEFMGRKILLGPAKEPTDYSERTERPERRGGDRPRGGDRDRRDSRPRNRPEHGSAD